MMLPGMKMLHHLAEKKKSLLLRNCCVSQFNPASAGFGERASKHEGHENDRNAQANKARGRVCNPQVQPVQYDEQGHQVVPHFLLSLSLSRMSVFYFPIWISLVRLETELKNLRDQYAKQEKEFKKKNHSLCEDYIRNLQQYERIQIKIK